MGAPKVFESAEALSFAAAWSPIISRTTLIPASLFVMIESSCKAEVTSPPQVYPNGLRAHKYRKTRLCSPNGRDRNYRVSGNCTSTEFMVGHESRAGAAFD